MDKDKLKIAVDIFGQEIVNEVVRQLKIADKDASGNLIRSIDYKLLFTNKGFNIRLLAANYYSIVDLGRKKGAKMPPISAISKWATLRNIPQTAIWAIAKSISINGIKPSNITDKTIQQITKNQSFKELQWDVRDWVDDVIDSMLDELIIKRSNKLGKVKFDL